MGRQAGRANSGTRRRGYGFIHNAVDDRTRLAYCEILDDERKETAAGFWERARDYFAAAGIEVKAVMTDYGSWYRSGLFAATLGETKHLKTRPYRPRTNGKVGVVQPNHGRGVGLRSRLPLRSRTPSRVQYLAPHLQSPPRPHLARRSITSRPRSQPHRTEHLARFCASNSYVWNYYGGPSADAARLQYDVFAQAVRSSDAAGLLDVLQEDGAFGCTTFEFEGTGRVSRHLLDSVTEINFLHRHGVLEREDVRVLDIGAGYGRMAHRLLEANPKLARYTCVDAAPESTFLCEFYLKPRGLQDRAEVIPLDETDERLDGKEYDLALNIHGFSECTHSAIEWWLQRVRRIDVPHLMSVPNERDRFLSTETDGSRRDYKPFLTELGYEVVAEESFFDDNVRLLLGSTESRARHRPAGSSKPVAALQQGYGHPSPRGCRDQYCNCRYRHR